MLEMINLISDLQSDRMNNQRAELRPVPKVAKDSKGASLPGMNATATTSMKPEEDFLEIIARVQGSRLEDQRTELPRLETEVEMSAPQKRQQTKRLVRQQTVPPTQAHTQAQAHAEPQPQAGSQPKAPTQASATSSTTDHDAEEAFFNQLMRAQGSRLEDQRAVMAPARPSSSKK